MALEKQIVIDRTEILEDGTIQIREKTRILEDGMIISEKNTDRRVIEPGDSAENENDEIKAIKSIIHTPQKIAAFVAKKSHH